MRKRETALIIGDVQVYGLKQDLLVKLQHFFQSRNVELTYLFGSRARGRVNFLSDYDFAVLMPDGGFAEYYGSQ